MFVLRQGEEGDTFYILYDGQASLTESRYVLSFPTCHFY